MSHCFPNTGIFLFGFVFFSLYIRSIQADWPLWWEIQHSQAATQLPFSKILIVSESVWFKATLLKRQLQTVPKHCTHPGIHIPAITLHCCRSVREPNSQKQDGFIQRLSHTSFTTSDSARRNDQVESKFTHSLSKHTLVGIKQSNDPLAFPIAKTACKQDVKTTLYSWTLLSGSRERNQLKNRENQNKY